MIYFSTGFDFEWEVQHSQCICVLENKLIERFWALLSFLNNCMWTVTDIEDASYRTGSSQMYKTNASVFWASRCLYPQTSLNPWSSFFNLQTAVLQLNGWRTTQGTGTTWPECPRVSWKSFTSSCGIICRASPWSTAWPRSVWTLTKTSTNWVMRNWLARRARWTDSLRGTRRAGMIRTLFMIWRWISLRPPKKNAAGMKSQMMDFETLFTDLQ